jgi:hypothetical protein
VFSDVRSISTGQSVIARIYGHGCGLAVDLTERTSLVDEEDKHVVEDEGSPINQHYHHHHVSTLCPLWACVQGFEVIHLRGHLAGEGEDAASRGVPGRGEAETSRETVKPQLAASSPLKVRPRT